MQKQFRDKNHKKQKKYLKNHKKRSLRPYKISKFFNYQTVYTLLSNPSVYMSVIVRNLKCLSTLYCRNLMQVKMSCNLAQHYIVFLQRCFFSHWNTSYGLPRFQNWSHGLAISGYNTFFACHQVFNGFIIFFSFVHIFASCRFVFIKYNMQNSLVFQNHQKYHIKYAKKIKKGDLNMIPRAMLACTRRGRGFPVHR